LLDEPNLAGRQQPAEQPNDRGRHAIHPVRITIGELAQDAHRNTVLGMSITLAIEIVSPR
jgi:hypothetical protein